MITGIRQQALGISKPKLVVYALCAVLFAFGTYGEAQQRGKIPRIGILVGSTAASVADRIEAFRQGLRERGYTEGQNITIEYRYAEGKLVRLSELAAELVHLKIDAIVTTGPAATRPAKEATTTIPIVMTFDDDPVGNGFVASLARPGGNITGLTTLWHDLTGKRLELLKEIVPKLSRVAVLGISINPGNAQALRETELAAAAFGLRVQYLEVRNLMDLEAAFREANKERADAILILPSPILNSNRTQLVEFAARSRIPTIYHIPEFVADGGLISYGVNSRDLFRRAATYVDKILKGAKPADLPVEQPAKFELVINLKAAKQIGLTIPPNVLARADKVIR
jgi:putative tryptophan/tyrosine transport system substrate-binding protein